MAKLIQVVSLLEGGAPSASSTLSKERGSFQPKLGSFPTQPWLHIGPITCWVNSTQQFGLVHLTQQLGRLVYFTQQIG